MNNLFVLIGDICEAGGWAYQVESVRVKNGALVKTKDGVFRTSMKRESTVLIYVTFLIIIISAQSATLSHFDYKVMRHLSVAPRLEVL